MPGVTYVVLTTRGRVSATSTEKGSARGISLVLEVRQGRQSVPYGVASLAHKERLGALPSIHFDQEEHIPPFGTRLRNDMFPALAEPAVNDSRKAFC